MRKAPWIFFFFSLTLAAAGQRNSDYGIFLGTSSYLGDINPNRLFYSPSPAGGIFYRYNFHPRHALRGNIFAGGLKGNDGDFNNSFQTTRSASFSGMVGELGLQFEFNFLTFTTQGKLWDFTPYFAAGIALSYIDISSESLSPVIPSTPISETYVTFKPVIPFSFGIKANIYKNMGLEAEFGFRKTFYDNFDGLKDFVAPSDLGWIHNNDWYSFAGIALTWKIYSKLVGCPAYSDVDGKRRR
jgi:hypothetical protein